MRIRLADKWDYEALLQLRRQVFEDEIGIQKPGYRDRITESISRTLLLMNGEGVFGSVRLAFSITDKDFYLSYLTIDSCKRNRASNVILIGALFTALRTNRIRVVHADAHAGVVHMYKRFGFRTGGSVFYKQGFNCCWWPMSYTVGTNETMERKLMALARQPLHSVDLRWCFPITVLLVKERQLEHAVSQVMERFDFGELLPVGQSCIERKDAKRILSSISDSITVTATEYQDRTLPHPSLPGLDPPHHEWDTGNAVLVSGDLATRAAARLYASLMRRRLLFNAHECSGNSFQSVFILGTLDEVDMLDEEVRRRWPRASRGLLIGPPSTISWVLVKSLLRHLHADWLTTDPLVSLPIVGQPCIDDQVAMHTLTATETTHVVTQFRHPERWPDILKKLNAGSAVGEAVRAMAPELRLIGDPAMRFYPNGGNYEYG
jgi:predicted GNAT family N-acyltransferase